MDIDGTKDNKPTHTYIELMYPEIYDTEKTTIEIAMCHVRAADSIRVSYDSERDGWIIEQGTRSSWSNEESEGKLDRGWKEVAFIEAWASDEDIDKE